MTGPDVPTDFDPARDLTTDALTRLIGDYASDYDEVDVDARPRTWAELTDDLRRFLYFAGPAYDEPRPEGPTR